MTPPRSDHPGKSSSHPSSHTSSHIGGANDGAAGGTTRSKKKTSNWRSVRMPHHATVARSLQQRYSLRWHGLCIGSLTLLGMLLAAWV